MQRDERKTKAELIRELRDLRAILDSTPKDQNCRVAEGLPQFVFELDIDGRLTYANEFALRNYGYTHEDVERGLTLADLLHPDHVPMVREHIAGALAGRPFKQREYLARRKDQSTFPIQVYSESIVEDDRIVGIRGVFIDITELKAVEDALRTSENYYRTLFENTGTAMAILGPDTVILSCNSQFVALCGFSAAEVEGRMSWTEFIDPEDLDRMLRYNQLRSQDRAEIPNNYEFTFLARGNQRKRINIFIRLIPNTDDRICSLIDITEHYQTLRALRESEERYQLMARGANDGLWDWDLATDEVFFSPRYRDILGYTEKEFPNHVDSWLNSLHPEDRDKALAANRQCIEGKAEQFQVEFRQMHKDGTPRWILGRGGCSRDEHGKVYRMSGTHTDITQRKEAEQALRESEERFRSMVEQATNGIYQTTLEGRFISANTALATILGYDSPQDLIDSVNNISHDIWVYPEDRERFREAIARKGELYNYELFCKRKDGKRIWISGNIRQVTDRKTGQMYYEGYLHDVTARKLNERTTHALYSISTAVSTTRDLKELYQTIHAIIDEVIPARNFFIAMVDETRDMMRFVYFQDEMDDYYDIPNISDPKKSSLSIHVFRTGKPLFLSQADPDWAERFQEVGVIGTPPAVWIGVPLKQGDTVVGAMAVQDYHDPLQYTDEAVTFMTAVSEQVAMAIGRKSVEEALTRLNEELEYKVDQRTAELRTRTIELEKANARLLKLDAVKSAMVSSVSHELRTPLTSIRGFAKLCIRDLNRYFRPMDLDETLVAKGRRIRSNLEIIETEGERLTRLINDFLDINRIESGKATWNDHFLNPCEVILKATSAAAGGFAANANVRLITELPESTRLIHADSDKIQQVLINLLNNAYKFTKRGSVTVSLKDDSDILTVSVTDTGSGVPPEEMGYIFEKFHKSRLGDTIRTEEKGTGLGLAICKEIVEHYGGSIWVNSKLGQGSTFSFSLPAVPGTEPHCG